MGDRIISIGYTYRVDVGRQGGEETIASTYSGEAGCTNIQKQQSNYELSSTVDLTVLFILVRTQYIKVTTRSRKGRRRIGLLYRSRCSGAGNIKHKNKEQTTTCPALGAREI